MDQQLTAPGQAESASRGHELSYDGKGGEIAKIALTNGLLGLVTLGVYRFWGKTRLRRYLWSHVSLDGDRLEYTGRGIDLHPDRRRRLHAGRPLPPAAGL